MTAEPINRHVYCRVKYIYNNVLNVVMHLCELIVGICRGLLSHRTSTASQRPGAALLKCLLRPLLHTCAHSTHLPRMQPFCVSKATLPASANTHLLLASCFQDVFKAADSPYSG